MNRTLKRFGLAAGAALMLTATTGVVADPDGQGNQGANQGRQDQRGRPGPLPPEGEGRRVFLRENCYGCHGGRAGGGMGPNLRDGRREPVEEYIHEGFEYGMPGFDLPEIDVRNLEAYFRSLRTPREPVFTHWWEPVPTR